MAERLTKLGVNVRIGSRSASPAFDWEDPNTWQKAVEGVDFVYVSYHPDLAFEGAAEKVDAFAKVAVANGVRRLVLLSGRNEEGAQRGEKFIQNSGAEWTIIRASWFNQNFSENYLLEPVLAGQIPFPAGNVAEPFIDVNDIVDIAVEALTTDKHVGKLYEVTGPRLLTFYDLAAEISKATGREITYVPVSITDYEAALLQEGVPAEFAKELIRLISAVMDGRSSQTTNGVQQALGRPARDFADYAKEIAATGLWTPSTSSAHK